MGGGKSISRGGVRVSKGGVAGSAPIERGGVRSCDCELTTLVFLDYVLYEST